MFLSVAEASPCTTSCDGTYAILKIPVTTTTRYSRPAIRATRLLTSGLNLVTPPPLSLGVHQLHQSMKACPLGRRFADELTNERTFAAAAPTRSLGYLYVPSRQGLHLSGPAVRFDG